MVRANGRVTRDVDDGESTALVWWRLPHGWKTDGKPLYTDLEIDEEAYMDALTELPEGDSSFLDADTEVTSRDGDTIELLEELSCEDDPDEERELTASGSVLDTLRRRRAVQLARAGLQVRLWGGETPWN